MGSDTSRMPDEVRPQRARGREQRGREAEMQARLARSANPTRDSFDGTLVCERTRRSRAPTRGRETVKLKAFVNFTNESSEAALMGSDTSRMPDEVRPQRARGREQRCRLG